MSDTLDTLTDEQLMAKVKQADRAALRKLYDRHAAGLTAFAAQTLSDPVEAADIVHETFISVWEKAEGFRENLSFKSWLFTIGRNKSVDRLRKGSRMTLGDPDTEVPDLDPNPEQVALNCEDTGRVRACLEKLSDAHRRVVSLAFYEDIAYREIAEIEDVSEGTVKSRIFHAKKLLMHCLSQ